MKVSVKVDISPREIADRQRKFLESASGPQAWLDARIIRDTDPFVPMDTGMLASSSIRASEPGTGEVVYDTPYAQKLYSGVTMNFSRDKHPQATHHWHEKAKSIWLDAWGRGVARLMGGIWRRG